MAGSTLSELVVSELVTNAIQHGEPRETLGVEVSADRQRIRITVADGSALRPITRHVEADATSGRGLHIVEALVDRWGTDADRGGGKHVWVELDAVGDESGSGWINSTPAGQSGTAVSQASSLGCGRAPNR